MDLRSDGNSVNGVDTSMAQREVRIRSRRVRLSTEMIARLKLIVGGHVWLSHAWRRRCQPPPPPCDTNTKHSISIATTTAPARGKLCVTTINGVSAIKMKSSEVGNRLSYTPRTSLSFSPRPRWLAFQQRLLRLTSTLNNFRLNPPYQP